MKITPINFTSFLEPELLSYWKDHRFAQGKKISVQRTHNLKLGKSTVNVLAKKKDGDQEILCSIQLTEIPQQEENAALAALIHLPHLTHPESLLMVFKKENDGEMWSAKIVEKTSILMISAPAESEPEAPADPIPTPAIPPRQEAEDEDETELEPDA